MQQRAQGFSEPGPLQKVLSLGIWCTALPGDLLGHLSHFLDDDVTSYIKLSRTQICPVIILFRQNKDLNMAVYTWEL